MYQITSEVLKIIWHIILTWWKEHEAERRLHESRQTIIQKTWRQNAERFVNGSLSGVKCFNTIPEAWGVEGQISVKDCDTHKKRRTKYQNLHILLVEKVSQAVHVHVTTHESGNFEAPWKFKRSLSTVAWVATEKEETFSIEVCAM